MPGEEETGDSPGHREGRTENDDGRLVLMGKAGMLGFVACGSLHKSSLV